MGGVIQRRLQALYYAVTAFIICWTGILPGQIADPDLWGRLSATALWMENGAFPYRDVFSFTAFHHRWIDHEWLSGFLFYSVLRWGGETALHGLKYGCLLLIFYLLFSLGKKVVPAGKSLPIVLFLSLLLLFPVYGDAFYPTVRSQIFSFVCFCIFLGTLEAVRLKRTAGPGLWMLLPMGVAWANAHGGFILGLILLFWYGLGELFSTRRLQEAMPYWRLAGILIFSIGVFNPYGFSYWPFIVHALAMPRPFIPEWIPIPLFTSAYWETQLLMLGILISLGFAVLAQWRQRKSSSHSAPASLFTPGLVLLFLMGVAMRGVRFKTFLAFGALFYLPVLWSTLKEAALTFFPQTQRTPDKRKNQAGPNSLLPNWVQYFPGIFALLTLVSLFSTNPSFAYFRTVVQSGKYAESRGLIPFPIAMTDYLKASPYRGNLINPFTWGEFLAWSLYPQFKMAWDGRYEEVYTPEEMQFYTAIYALPLRKKPSIFYQLLNQSRGDFLLIEKISPNQSLMGRNPDWQLLAQDGFYFFYGRKSSLKHFPVYRAPVYRAKVTAKSRVKIRRRYQTIGDFFEADSLGRFRTL